MRKNLRKWLLGVIAAVSLAVTACQGADVASGAGAASDIAQAAGNILGDLAESKASGAGSDQSGKSDSGSSKTSGSSGTLQLSDIPEYSGSPYVAVNGNVPYFSESDLTDVTFESYSDLDALGRCGVAYASVSTDTMPTEKRGSIGEVKPTGWHNKKYDFVDGKYVYNRCHLIGYQLTAENANEKNLITGTRYLNVQGMLPFENLTADYVKETENHVLYRVTPVFEGNNLVAAGVLMEAESVEDKGEGVEFCVFVYNAQPGVTIDYATGDSWLDENGTGNQQAAAKETKTVVETEIQAEKQTQAPAVPAKQTSTYILNTNSKKFHKPGCSAVSQMKESNKAEFTGTRDEVIAKGYEPCKKCNP